MGIQFNLWVSWRCSSKSETYIFFFLANFYVLEMKNDKVNGYAPLILGRVVLKTAKTIFNVQNGILTLIFGDNIVHFNMENW